MTDQEALARIMWAKYLPSTDVDFVNRETGKPNWVSMSDTAAAILTALPTLDYVKSTRVKELEANQRTPGTVEHCGNCCLSRSGLDLDATPMEYDQWATCKNDDCPIRTADIEPVRVTYKLAAMLCEDCPRVGHSTDYTRCKPCPRRTEGVT